MPTCKHGIGLDDLCHECNEAEYKTRGCFLCGDERAEGSDLCEDCLRRGHTSPHCGELERYDSDPLGSKRFYRIDQGVKEAPLLPDKGRSSGDAIKCPACGVALVDHLGLYGTCAELQAARKRIEELNRERRSNIELGEI
jgi:hypothetical protein